MITRNLGGFLIAGGSSQNYPDARLSHHCQMRENEETLFSPNSTECEAVKAVEEELEDAVARYAKDNLLVVRVRKSFPL